MTSGEMARCKSSLVCFKVNQNSESREWRNLASEHRCSDLDAQSKVVILTHGRTLETFRHSARASSQAHAPLPPCMLNEIESEPKVVYKVENAHFLLPSMKGSTRDHSK